MTRLPSRGRLEQALGSVLGDSDVEVLAREPNPFRSTFPSELVTCRSKNSEMLKLFCKYGPTDYQSSHGHRGGVAYEAGIYRHVLAASGLPAPRFYGNHADDESGTTWLFLEFLETSKRVNRAGGELLDRAAVWAARFHARFQESSPVVLERVHRHDHEYYAGWVRRTALYSRPLRHEFSWLPALCRRFEEFIPTLLAYPMTVFHGEFTVRNVLVDGAIVRPVDWQSAAIGLGEYDLVSLTERWPEAVVQACERAYERARWPDGTPEHFAESLAAARAHLQFRWLGDTAVRTRAPDNRWRLDELRSAGERLGMV